MMQDAIRDFPKQFTFEPTVVNKEKLKMRYKKYVVIGMGGSHLAADLAVIMHPDLPLHIWSDYGLPSAVNEDTLVIASSYSGNTEETIDGLSAALEKKVPVAVIAVGGKLLETAKHEGLPYVELPNTGIQPRSALGFSLRALLALLQEEAGLAQTAQLAATLHAEKHEREGKILAEEMKGCVPVIYSSKKNVGIAYNWKIKLNETGKIPAFYNVVPELNHNEMNGLDVTEQTKSLSQNFFFLFLTDDADHERVQKRMTILERLYRERNLRVKILPLTGGTATEKIFSSLLLADWTAVAIADIYGLEAEQVPMVEEFKTLMQQ